MTAPVSPPQPTAEPVRQHTPLWELHRQDDYADHEFSFWFDGEIVVLANPAFGRVAVLQEMVDGLNSHASLKARAKQAEQEVYLLESNAREQAKLLADTGRRVEELEAALRKSNDALSDWLAFAEEELGEFDLEVCDFGGATETLCHKCESSGCINLKIRNTRAALPPSTPAVSR